MKLKSLILIVLALCAFAVPALAQDTNRVIFNDFSFSYDSSLATNVNIVQFAGDPPELEQPGGPEVKHTEFRLHNALTNDVPSSFEAPAFIRVYRTADFAGYDSAANNVQQLTTLLAASADLAQFTTVDAENTSSNQLPFMPEMPAGQIIRARAQYAETPFVRGISYVTVYRQDVSPFLANEFWWTFQGVSVDGVYYISALVRLNTPLFPAEFPAEFDMATFESQFVEYLTQSVVTLNNAAQEEFTPNLSMLDTLVQSFTFESLAGVPVPLPEPLPSPDQPTPDVEPTEIADATFGGLACPTWTLVSFTLPDATQPVIEGTTVTLSFNQEGAGG
ncbi:MAG: hypothetical protein H7175_11250, partial [Burkholderiales bacterium]|nr:hypothetical protein [Anaerolineae bacterium]